MGPVLHNSRVIVGWNGRQVYGKEDVCRPFLTQINFSKGKSTVDLGQAAVDLGLELGWLVVMGWRGEKINNLFFPRKRLGTVWNTLERLGRPWNRPNAFGFEWGEP
jgi:hypothetical protein